MLCFDLWVGPLISFFNWFQRSVHSSVGRPHRWWGCGEWPLSSKCMQMLALDGSGKMWEYCRMYNYIIKLCKILWVTEVVWSCVFHAVSAWQSKCFNMFPCIFALKQSHSVSICGLKTKSIFQNFPSCWPSIFLRILPSLQPLQHQWWGRGHRDSWEDQL